MALLLDKEYYKEAMENQGLEFDISPKKEILARVKKVTFNLNSKTSVAYAPDASLEEEDEDDATDLAVWEDRDPDLDAIDFSFSSEGSSFESSFGVRNSFESGADEVLNVFSGADDGWEHFNGESSAMEWPDMMQDDRDSLLVIEDGKASEAKDTTEETEEMQDSSNDAMNQSSVVYDADSDDGDDDAESDASDSESEGEDFEDDANCFGDHSFSSEMDVSFVEKIARENYSRAIHELQEDDESAQDSWAQSEECVEVTDSIEIGQDHDKLESSIDAQVEPNVDVTLEPSKAEDLRAAHNASKPTEDVPPLDHSHCSSLDYSYTSSKSYLSSSEEWDSNVLNFSDPNIHPVNPHEEFDNSQIIAESPDGFFSEDEGDEDSEHDEFVRKMTEYEFSGEEISPCDSSGGGKTITTTSTAETFAMSAQDHASVSSGSSCDREELMRSGRENVLGIIRRDAYIPSIDSPQHSRKQLGDELDYLESKVKDLQLKKDNNASTATKTGYPIQMPRVPVFDMIFDDNIIGERKSSLEELAPSQRKEVELLDFEVGQAFAGDVTKDEEVPKQPASTTSGRRHPAAARLKALKQSNAWKRRYGRLEKD